MRPAELQLDLDSFEGPFDLLCTVLLRRELTLADVRVVEIVVAYVQQLAIAGEVDHDTASEFLVLISALLEIKARELLAADEADELELPTADESQTELLERLVRYATLKNAAAGLRERGSVRRYWRVASRPHIRRQAHYDQPVFDPAVLRRSIDVLLAQPDVDVRHLVGRHASVSEMSQRLLGLLRSRRAYTFDEAVSDCNRLDQAVAFVALLELCRAGQIAVAQKDLFGPIVIARDDSSQIAANEAGAADVAPGDDARKDLQESPGGEVIQIA